MKSLLTMEKPSSNTLTPDGATADGEVQVRAHTRENHSIRAHTRSAP